MTPSTGGGATIATRTQESGSSETALAAADIVVVPVALALALGLAEVALLATARFYLHKYMHLNPQIVWLAPAEYGIAAAVFGALVLGLGRRWRRPAQLRLASAIAIFLGVAGMLFVWQRLHKAAVLLVAAGVAVQLSKLIASHPATARRWSRLALPVLAALVALAGLGLNARWALAERRGAAALPAAPPGAPNIIVIIWDTVRAANLSLYGYDRETTPALDSLAAHGLVFERALSPAPWTLPAHASMFTGQPPATLEADWRRPLRSGPPTLAELLRDHGYRTGGFVANTYYTSRESGLQRGFLHYEDYPVVSAGSALMATSLVRELLGKPAARRALGLPSDPMRKLGETVSDEFLDWVGDAPDRPFFAFLNYFDGHAPYLPPAPFDTAFGPLLPGRNPDMVDGRTFTPRELKAEIDAYDGSIAYLDHQLSLLLAELDRRGLLRNTLVVVTADHGEEFGEHRVFTHGNSLYDPVLHVPLLLMMPGRLPEGMRIDEWVTTEDLAATVADIAGLDRGGLGGRSLAAAWTPSPSAPDTLVATVTRASGHPTWYPVTRGDMTAIMADPLKYILNGDGVEELYDLRADPGETHNLIGAAGVGGALKRLRALAEAALGGHGPR